MFLLLGVVPLMASSRCCWARLSLASATYPRRTLFAALALEPPRPSSLSLRAMAAMVTDSCCRCWQVTMGQDVRSHWPCEVSGIQATLALTLECGLRHGTRVTVDS